MGLLFVIITALAVSATFVGIIDGKDWLIKAGMISVIPIIGAAVISDVSTPLSSHHCSNESIRTEAISKNDIAALQNYHRCVILKQYESYEKFTTSEVDKLVKEDLKK